MSVNLVNQYYILIFENKMGTGYGINITNNYLVMPFYMVHLRNQMRI